MIELIPHMPLGTIGVRASGKITDEDYRDVLVPHLADALQHGKVKLLYVLEEDSSYSAGAAWEDTKLWARHLTGWQKVAVVSDADWLEHGIKAFGWLMPGEIRVFDLDDVDDAQDWLAASDDDEDD
jgi:hypothetical protein